MTDGSDGPGHEDRAARDALAASARLVRAPITAILTQVELLRDGAFGELSPDSLDALDAIADGARAVLVTHERMELLARLYADGHGFEGAAIDVDELVQPAVLASRAKLEAAHLRLEVAVAPELPLVLGRARDVHEVLVELIRNAARHTPAGGNLRLRAALDDRPGAVRFTISDSGPGMAPDVVEALRGRAGAERGWPHLDGGLGLAFVGAVVRAHGGRLGIESTSGLGTNIWFTLPVARREGRARAAQGRPRRS